MPKDNRFGIFQSKIVHYILPTNATLFRDWLISSEQCHLCNEKQTLQHLFVTCSHVLSFWAHFTNWWKNQEAITLSDTDNIYGITNGPTLRLGLNLCGYNK